MPLRTAATARLAPAGPARMIRGIVPRGLVPGLVLAGLLAACSSPQGLDSPEPRARLDAIRVAVANGDRSVMPDLIRMLDSSDAAVRLIAIRSLERLTRDELGGELFGYDYAAPAWDRRESVERWVRWYDEAYGGESGADGERSTERTTDVHRGVPGPA